MDPVGNVGASRLSWRRLAGRWMLPYQHMVRVRMDWKLALMTFGTVFLAELGDKTQLATLAFATTGRSRWAVFTGAACALVATSAIAVLLGEVVTRVVPPTLFKRAAGGAFVLIGFWVLWSSRSAG